MLLLPRSIPSLPKLELIERESKEQKIKAPFWTALKRFDPRFWRVVIRTKIVAPRGRPRFCSTLVSQKTSRNFFSEQILLREKKFKILFLETFHFSIFVSGQRPKTKELLVLFLLLLLLFFFLFIGSLPHLNVISFKNNFGLSGIWTPDLLFYLPSLNELSQWHRWVQCKNVFYNCFNTYIAKK